MFTPLHVYLKKHTPHKMKASLDSHEEFFMSIGSGRIYFIFEAFLSSCSGYLINLTITHLQ